MPDLLSIVWWRNFYSRVGRGFGWGCLIVFGVPLVIGFGWNQYGGSGGRGGNGGDANAVIALVNGEPITEAQYRKAIPERSSGSGEEGARQAAKNEGAAMDKLVAATVLHELAGKYKVKVNDAEVDRKVKEAREQILGKNATDAQWEDYLVQNQGGMTPADFRDSVAKDTSMLASALLEKFKAMEVVTPEDIKNQNQEVQVRLVQIGYGRSMFADPKKQAKTLTEDEAKKKAEDLLAKARAGADITALARANSTDFATKQKGGDLGFVPEYRKSPNQMGQGAPQEMLASIYGKDFAAAVHKTATGQFTDVVKTSTFGSTGFAFGKVVARRDIPTPQPDPKNPAAKPAAPDPKAIAESLKQERASEKLDKEFKTAFNTARVHFQPAGAEAKAYYDYAKAEEKQNQAMMAQFGQSSDEPVPSPAEINILRTNADKELEAQLAKRPTDSTLALIVGRNLKTKMDLAPSDQKAAMRDRLIALYQTALKGIEDRNLRFDLADLYRDKGDTANAEALYQKISHLMDIAPGYDTRSLTDEQTARKRLVTAFQAIQKPDEADAEKAKLAKIDVRLVDARRREAEEQKKSQTPGGSLAPGGSTGGTLTLPTPTSKGTPGQ